MQTLRQSWVQSKHPRTWLNLRDGADQTVLNKTKRRKNRPKNFLKSRKKLISRLQNLRFKIRLKGWDLWIRISTSKGFRDQTNFLCCKMFPYFKASRTYLLDKNGPGDISSWTMNALYVSKRWRSTKNKYKKDLHSMQCIVLRTGRGRADRWGGEGGGRLTWAYLPQTTLPPLVTRPSSLMFTSMMVPFVMTPESLPTSYKRKFWRIHVWQMLI